MKFVIFFVFIIFSANSFAEPESLKDKKTLSEVTPDYAPALHTNNEELANLLRAHTTAIEVLASKLDSLEARINKIDKEPH